MGPPFSPPPNPVVGGKTTPANCVTFKWCCATKSAPLPTARGAGSSHHSHCLQLTCCYHSLRHNSQLLPVPNHCACRVTIPIHAAPPAACTGQQAAHAILRTSSDATCVPLLLLGSHHRSRWAAHTPALLTAQCPCLPWGPPSPQCDRGLFQGPC